MTGVEIYPTKVFTREVPCTKVDIVNCFWRKDSFERVPVVQARGYIGLNVPKYLLREGIIIQKYVSGVDYYWLTSKGMDWLLKGLARHLELHPEEVDRLVSNPIEVAADRRAAKTKPQPTVARVPRRTRAQKRH